MSINITLFYSILHLLVDGICAFAMFAIFLPQREGMLFLILYNFCAFALQMPFGVILDMLQIRLEQRAHFDIKLQLDQADAMPENKNWLATKDFFTIENKKQMLCLITVAVGLLFTILGTVTHPVILGIGNALFHIGGGVGTIHEDTAKNWNGKGLGVFVAPGALGLYLGTIAGKNGIRNSLLWIMCALLAGLFVALLYLWNRSINGNKDKQIKGYELLPKQMQLKEMQLKQTLCLAVCCVLVVILRSYIGMAVVFPWKTTALSGLLAVLAIVLGKMAGGIIGAKYGFWKTTIISLLFAAICYIGSAWMLMGIAALLLFNMTMPITLYLLVSKLPQLSGFCFGLLTFALFLGFLPEYFGLRAIVNGNIIGSVGSIISLLLLQYCFIDKNKRK